MHVELILFYQGAAGRCSVALDAAGQPVRLWLERISDDLERLRCHDTVIATVRAISPEQGGVFLESDTGEELFLSMRKPVGLHEGQKQRVRVVSEARTGKLARVVMGQTASDAPGDPYQAWLDGLPAEHTLTILDDADAALRIDDILEDAATSRLVLKGGGAMHLFPTPALLAADIDTAGRMSRGTAGARAHAVNLAAAKRLAREAALRDLGGALVLDCVAPVSATSGKAVRSAFLDTFRALTPREVRCLVPSPFGLMEAALAWGARPLHERMLATDGTLNAHASLWGAMRQVERYAGQVRSRRLRLDLPSVLFTIFEMHKSSYLKALHDRFGARIDVQPTPKSKADVCEL